MNRVDMRETELLEDAALVGLCRQGDRDAFERIVERYQSLVCGLAYSACGDVSRSEDLAQETFIAAWREIASLKEPAKLKHWLCGILRNLSHNSARAQTRNPLHSAVALEDEMNSGQECEAPSEEAMSKEEEAMLWRVLETLPQTYREPLVLFYRSGDSTAEVADALELSEEAVRQRLARGRALVQERVTRLVESGLRRSNPTKTFTVAVLAALPLAYVQAGASAATVGTTIASTPTATAVKAIAMANIQKILIVIAVAAPAVTGVYEALRISHLRGQVQAIQEEQAPLSDRISQMGQQQEDAMKRLTAAREENGQLQRNVAELRRLRGQVAQWQGDSAELARLKAAPEAKLRSWVARAVKLKQRFERMPDKRIPEFQLVSPQDFQQELLSAVKDRQLDTEKDWRIAMSEVRKAAEYKFACMAQRALKQYAETNNGQFPPDLSRLKPYFESPVDDAVLARFKIVPADQAGKLAAGNDGWVMLQKAPVDEEYDKRWMIGLMGVRVTGEDGRWTSKAE
jgi:RNA polymerase sigma factor (sigma-70 family)